jgi:hypothetical protein
MAAVAELLCQRCEAIVLEPIGGRPQSFLPCECGGRLQVVRIFADRRKMEMPVSRERREKVV